VSVDAVHTRFPIVLAAPLTSKLEKAEKFRQARISLPKDSAWMRGREMADDSLILTEQVRVLAHERLHEGPVAKLTPTSMAAVEAGLAFVLGMPV
jgi:mRNA-degrading endonuclease toxin of MazEF toxin-antitoxin module